LLGKAELLSHQLQIGYLQGEISRKESQEEGSLSNDAAVETATSGKATQYTLEQLKDINFLVNNFYIVDPSTKITDSLFDGEKLVGKDMTIKQTSDAPQILIYHTHSQEGYINSRPGKVEDTVVGVGSYLMKILEEDYGYNVIHDTSEYDLVNGVLDRDVAYNQAKAGITKILEKNPTIEVVIDLHRDSPAARNTVVNGKETAQIMLFNGLSRDQKGPITYLDNPSLQDNLAFSLQLQLKSKEKYPGLFFKNYLKCYRYNLHVRPKSILIELGTEQNTLESAMNAMDPFAEILDSVLQGK
jgi:stage II sporulation protein P